MSRIAELTRVGRAVVEEARDDRVTFLAAAVAYYGFVSIVPLLLLVVAVGTAVGGDRVTAYVVDVVGALLTDSGTALVRSALENAAGRRTATVLGLALLLWSGIRVFRGLDLAFADIYRVGGAEPLTQQVRDALLVLAAMGAAVVAAAAVGVLVPLLAAIPFEHVLAPVVLAGTLTLAFLPLFYVFPDVELELAETLPGTALAAVGWTALAEVFRVYTGYVGDYQIYGLLGAAILLVTWLYFGSIVIMVGAVLNAVLAGRTEEPETPPEEDVERPKAAPDIADVAGDVEAVRRRLEEKTVDREEFERELEAYVDRRVSRNHARGWGPYLVLLYGTLMTLGAFFWLDGGWAVGAMIVIWLSTLGLYVLMLLFGVGLNAAGVPGKAIGWVQSRRE